MKYKKRIWWREVEKSENCTVYTDNTGKKRLLIEMRGERDKRSERRNIGLLKTIVIRLDSKLTPS